MPTDQPSVLVATEPRARPFRWLVRIKAVAIAWVFLNHVAEAIFGYPHIANPTGNWAPLSERLAQLRPLDGYGVWNVPANLLRYVGWFGDQGVHLFLIASGFGLTWGLLARHGLAPLELGRFYRRRAARILPMWLAIHLFVGAVVFATQLGPSVTPRTLLFSVLGLRFTSGMFYAISPAWWYIGLLLQLYLVYPLLWSGLRRLGPTPFLVLSCGVAFAARAVGLLAFDGYIDAWQRGAVFITRLPEFALGMSLAMWMRHTPDGVARALRSGRAVVAAALCYVLGVGLSLTLVGMAFAPFLLGLGAFTLLYAAFTAVERSRARWLRPGDWLGAHSYSLYLVQGLVIGVVLSSGALAGAAAAAGLSLVFAMLLERAGTTIARVARWSTRAGPVRVSGAAVATAGVVCALLIGAELLVRQLDPQEVLGWGERASLQPHAELGWHLKPNQHTRLRWESYDYHVQANALGFPGPAYPERRAPNTLRIMTVGDAFTSAEGVDTNQAWPRLLERELAMRRSGGGVEVLNFGITGHGPNQYAAVVKAFAPRYRPDLIIIGTFVNDYEDVLRENRWFQTSIGFGARAQDGWYAFATLRHLRRFLQRHAARVRNEWLRGTPWRHGYFLGNFRALERGRQDITQKGRRLLSRRFAAIKGVADAIGARVVLAMIPAPVQVCGPTELTYYPKHVDLNDPARFDLDQPQRMTCEIAGVLGLACYDLRAVLKSVTDECPYQARNMHWTPSAHRAVARYLAGKLTSLNPDGGRDDRVRPNRQGGR